jgi:glycosyltransferase involved in cell wall biosynthesis
MAWFLLGGHFSNGGPDNVNQALITSADNKILYVKYINRMARVLESFWKILISEGVVVSGTCAKRYYDFMKLLRKNYVYLMHGCIDFENEINRLYLAPSVIENERRLLKGAKRIVCVSEAYSEWVKKRYPEYAEKITFVNNGIELKQREKKEKEPFSIAVSGGNRCIKNNLEVSRAVRKLNAEGILCKMYIFGRKYPDNEEIEETDYISYCGHMDKVPYYERLDYISCYVLNSEVEPFGLVAADALNCNCSLLMSQNVGAKSIMTTRKCDIIQDPHDVDEIVGKLKYVFEHPNSDRLYGSIDVQACSERSSFQKLDTIVEGAGK